MFTLVLAAVSTGAVLLLGAVLGLYFRVWIMVPATIVVAIISIVMFTGTPLAVWMRVVCILGLITALQLGYVLGSAFGPPLVTETRRKNRDVRFLRPTRPE